MFTRRQFGMAALGAFAAVFNGVRLGVQTYSFRDVPRTAEGDMIEPLIRAMAACGFTECELWAPQIEPATPSRDDLRRWRLQTPREHFLGIKRKFDAAGIAIYGFNYSPKADYTDAEIDRGFEIGQTLGAEIITASTTLDVAKRIAPLADKHRMVVAMHGHSNVTDPNELATPDSFAAALKMSTYFKINLDIGHFTAANFDPVAYIREHHASITNLHLKDRRKNQGANVPWGEGDTPIREVLQLLKKERWPIPALVEYEYPGKSTPIEESKTCLAYAQRMLA